MRALVLVGLLCISCTRPNPAFDGDAATNGEDVGDPVTVGPGTVGSGVGTLDPETLGPTTAAEDFPLDPGCEQQLSPGLSIRLADPAMLEGGMCPPIMSFPMRLVGVAGNEVMVEPCLPGCGECSGVQHPLSVDLIPLGDLVPSEPCLVLEAQPNVTIQDEDRCHWGALTIHDPELAHPYVIATSRSVPPTPSGSFLLGNAVPSPTPGPVCTCESIGQDNDCCRAGEPPTFFYYTIGGIDVYPGGDAPIVLQTGLVQSFHSFQAEHIPTCQDQQIQLSWAVVAGP